jgi:DNA-binding transcriptional MerR regulator
VVPEGRTIGEVLNGLRPEFDDVSISKIRFLESEGLIRPGRSDSGYRQFSAEDVDRLRYILTAQRDRYLPLRVIKEELARLDAGLPVETEVTERAGVRERSVERDRAALLTDVALDRTELAHASGLTTEEIDELITNGILATAEPFDGAALRAARLAGEMLRRGLEPRHLRAYRLAAEAGFHGVDTAESVERFSTLRVEIVAGDPDNAKVTFFEDLIRAEERAATWQQDAPSPG